MEVNSVEVTVPFYGGVIGIVCWVEPLLLTVTPSKPSNQSRTDKFRPSKDADELPKHTLEGRGQGPQGPLGFRYRVGQLHLAHRRKRYPFMIAVGK